MISRVIELSVKNRAIVLLAVVGLIVWGLFCLYRTPIDAIPDLSENQVIVWADWSGRSPREVEDQITYPLSVNLQGLAGVKSIRASSDFGFSMVTVIFEDKVDFYFARQRVLERLSTAATFLPAGVVPYLAADASALGQIFWYTVEGEEKSLDELRAIQDWYVRYQLYVPGVAEVASVGGFVREYQVDVDPGKLRAYDLSLGQVFSAVQKANSSVGGKVIQKGGYEYLVRGIGWIRNMEDIAKTVITERNGVPISVEQVATVQLGPAFRRGALEKDGGEAVGGVVLMRQGENPLRVIERVKDRIQELQPGLPSGTRIVPFYDRTGLIEASIGTLRRALVEEIAIASLVVFLVLWHARSALVITVTLPLAVLISFIFMYYLGIPSNIMSLSGIAISIGVLVDAGIVMTENAYNHLQEKFGSKPVTGDTRPLVIEACKVVGGPLFFSILIMLLSFAPVLVLGGREGKMFNPLAYTKSFALAGVAVLAITLVPALIPTFVRGRLRSQEDVWLVRSFVRIYRPLLELFLRHPDIIVVITGIFLLAGLPIFPRKTPWIFFVMGTPFIIGFTVAFAARRKVLCFSLLFLAAVCSFQVLRPLGEEFMPPLDELSIMDMPITRPNVNITQAVADIRERDSLIRGFPEVHQVVGKLGRVESPTDPAPIDMVETVVTLRDREAWPKRKVNYEDVTAEGREVARRFREMGILSAIPEEKLGALENAAAMHAAFELDAWARSFCARSWAENLENRGRLLVRHLLGSVETQLLARKALKQQLPPAIREELEAKIAPRAAERFREWILLEDVSHLVSEVLTALRADGTVEGGLELLAAPRSLATNALEPLRALLGTRQASQLDSLRKSLEAEASRLDQSAAKELGWRLEDQAPWQLVALLTSAILDQAREEKALEKEPSATDLDNLCKERARELAPSLYLWKKSKADLVKELHTALQVPGWSNIWTQPIINRVEMLSTGVRTQIGVKVYGSSLEELQRISNVLAEELRKIPGAVDVTADQIVGEEYLEIAIDRERAARYGVTLEDVQDVIEVALGGKEITSTVEARRRFPVRVRYPRTSREDEEAVKRILVPASASEGTQGEGSSMGSGQMAPSASAAEGGSSGSMGMGMGGSADSPGTPAPASVVPRSKPSAESEDSRKRLRQVPLSLVAEVRVVPGPSMIKSENGLLRTFVSLNVRERDIVGFVDEAQERIATSVPLPSGYYIEWSGQFEHQVRAQKTLTLVLPAVIFVIFLILYLTYRDIADTCMMFLAVPGAIAGGALFQYLLPLLGVDVSGNFSVAVWVGYIACFGLATETSIVMLVYLREAIDKRGGLEKIRSEEEIKEAVIEGAVHRLRPKLLTEGTTILALIPMLWATGVGAEYMRPMAAPILGGILVADEVIDILIPVLFHRERVRRYRALQKKRSGTEVAAVAGSRNPS